uniref:RNA polymerase sigma factor n=1 Tax=Roseihalotalea indica TaxID=2867963 RepID=A0AA49JD32_9BACT|nr:RNA polymerase sigma-70 factor [Tunicatimonas sp. TK19036]
MPSRVLNEDDVRCYVKKVQNGDPSSFEILFYWYQPRLYRFCLHLTHSSADAEEIVQEVFVKVWETRHRLNADLDFSAYLLKIAKNLIYTKASQRIREQAFQHYQTIFQAEYSNATQEEINRTSTEKVIRQLIEQLPFMQRKVFTLSRLSGYTNQEIAERLQLSSSTVENHLYLALKKLKKQLQKLQLYTLLLLFNFF